MPERQSTHHDVDSQQDYNGRPKSPQTAQQRLPGCAILHADFREGFPEADLIFLNPPFLDEAEIEQLLSRFRQCNPGTKVVTVSFSFGETSGFSLKEKSTASFPWGRADVTIHEVMRP